MLGKDEVEAVIGVLESASATIDTWLLIFTIVVAVGVVGEAVFGVAHLINANKLQPLRAREAQLTALQISDANARALEAQAALDKYKSPRSLTPDQQERISIKLRAFKGARFDMSLIPGDPDAMALQRLIANLLKAAGWEQVDWNPPGGPLTIVFTNPGEPNVGQGGGVGVDLVIHPDHANKFWPATHALSDALNAEGIIGNAEASPIAQIHNHDTIHIVVGKKPQ